MFVRSVEEMDGVSVGMVVVVFDDDEDISVTEVIKSVVLLCADTVFTKAIAIAANWKIDLSDMLCIEIGSVWVWDSFLRLTVD